MASTVIYVGKEIIKVDLDHLLDTEISSLDKITYEIAKKYGDFIAAIEITVEDCLGTVVNIIDEVSYKLAIADLINIISSDKEENAMSTTTNNVTVNEATKEVAMTEVTTNNETIKEEAVMVEDVKVTVHEVVDNIFDVVDESIEAVRVKVGDTKEDFVERAEDSVNNMKAKLGGVLEFIDEVLGFTSLKNSLMAIIEAGTYGKSSSDAIKKMARKCDDLITEEIEFINEFGNEESLKKAMQLKALTKDGNGQSVFGAFASGCIYVGRKITKKLRDWFHIDDEKSVMGRICNGISKFIGILKAGAKIVWKGAKLILCYTVAIAVKVFDMAFNAIKELFTKVKDWAVIKYEKFTAKDVDDFEDDFEDDFTLDEEGYQIQ